MSPLSHPSICPDVLFESGGDQKVALLLQYLLDSLHKIFLYDTQRFLSKERADALLGPLLDQVTPPDRVTPSLCR